MDKEQQDSMENDERGVSKFMRDFLNDPTREVQEPFFTNNEVSYCKNMSHHGFLTCHSSVHGFIIFQTK
jgi:hypothetical protein